MNRRAGWMFGVGLLLIALGGLIAPGVSAQGDPLDADLRAVIAAYGLEPLAAIPPADPALIALGEALFFDPVLSGSRDTACATCHHPTLHTADGLALGLGTGTSGLGTARFHAPGRPFIARHAPDLYNRGADAWHVMFWDGRVLQRRDGTFDTPAGDALPPGLDSILAAQAMFPVTAAAEMRGMPGDVDIFGAANELAPLLDANLEPDYPAIWDALMVRLLAIPGYHDLFAAAYPDAPPDALGFQHAANAIAAYEASAFTFTGSPWDRYLAGDEAALEATAKRGALLFYGEAGCARCHAGSLLTDQAFHNVGMPQLGPGQEEESPLDYGRGRETGQDADRYAFRTPPLRNVAITAPYGHNGAYATLDAMVRHMAAPVDGLLGYDAGQLIPELQANVWDDPATTGALLGHLDPLAGATGDLSDDQIDDLLAFLHALTDPAAADLDALVPDAVPSGLPVE
jgi:cytochrome c peroxidase